MWGIAFRARQFAKGSLWLLPLIGAVLGVVLGSIRIDLDKHAHLSQIWEYSPATATTLLSAVVGATAALTGFVVTVSVLVVQMATQTFSARYMRLWYRDGLLKATLAVIVGTLTFSFALLRRVSTDFVPNLGDHGRRPASCWPGSCSSCSSSTGSCTASVPSRSPHSSRRPAAAALEESPATTAPVAAVDIPEGHAGAAGHRRDGGRDPGGPRRGTRAVGAQGTTACSSCGRRSATSSRRAAC